MVNMNFSRKGLSFRAYRYHGKGGWKQFVQILESTYCLGPKLDEQLRFYLANPGAIFLTQKTSGMSAVEELNLKLRDAVKYTSGAEAKNDKWSIAGKKSALDFSNEQALQV
jgi:hypothetical protein